MTIIIPEEYVEIKHPIIEEKCPVCGEVFKVGDSIELVPIQKSKDGKAFNAVAITIHTDCYYV